MTHRIVTLLPVLALLAACGNEPANESEQGGKAAGEVLGGTISDDMIALDQLTSQSPPEVATADTGAGAGSEVTDGEEETASDPQPETEAAPASEPAEE